jgi:FkbM family methyltransferase
MTSAFAITHRALCLGWQEGAKYLASRLIARAHARIPYWLLEAHQVFEATAARGGSIEREGPAVRVRLPGPDGGGPLAFVLRRGTSDFGACCQVIFGEEYKALLDLVRERVQPNSIEYIIDAGANIGCATVLLARTFPAATIAAIEPDPGNFELLRRNVAANSCEHVLSFQAALWPRDEDLELVTGFRDGREWSRAVQPARGEEPSIRGVTLRTLSHRLRFPRIDILKLDVEGSERELLANDQATARLLDGVRFLAAEIHPEFLDLEHVKGLLQRHGFRTSLANQTIVASRET